MQEMIHVFGIEAAVLFWVGSGQALLAYVLERKRAVALVRNAQEKKFVKATLVRAVKTLGLAPDRRPPKPAELMAWETRQAVGGAPVPTPKPPAVPPAPSGVPAPGGAAPSVFTVRPPAAVPPASGAPAATPAPLAPAPPPAAALAAFGASSLQ